MNKKAFIKYWTEDNDPIINVEMFRDSLEQLIQQTKKDAIVKCARKVELRFIVFSQVPFKYLHIEHMKHQMVEELEEMINADSPTDN